MTAERFSRRPDATVRDRRPRSPVSGHSTQAKPITRRRAIPTRLALTALMLNTLAATTVTRLLQHAQVLLTHGTDSHGLAQATAARAMPLA